MLDIDTLISCIESECDVTLDRIRRNPELYYKLNYDGIRQLFEDECTTSVLNALYESGYDPVLYLESYCDLAECYIDDHNDSATNHFFKYSYTNGARYES